MKAINAQDIAESGLTTTPHNAKVVILIVFNAKGQQNHNAWNAQRAHTYRPLTADHANHVLECASNV